MTTEILENNDNVKFKWNPYVLHNWFLSHGIIKPDRKDLYELIREDLLEYF